MNPKATDTFDKNYYDKFYRSQETKVTDREELKTLVQYVTSYIHHIGIDVSTVLDVGCGLGLWQKALRKHLPKIKYHGLEYSKYLCEKYGWQNSTASKWTPRKKFDLVICQGVLQYLSKEDCIKAIRNLSRWTEGVLYLEVLTKKDWEENCDQSLTDGNVHIRTGSWYRKELGKYFKNCGGGLYLPLKSEAVLYELETLG